MAGASREQLEAAEDDDDARGAMIDLVLKYEKKQRREALGAGRNMREAGKGGGGGRKHINPARQAQDDKKKMKRSNSERAGDGWKSRDGGVELA